MDLVRNAIFALVIIGLLIDRLSTERECADKYRKYLSLYRKENNRTLLLFVTLLILNLIDLKKVWIFLIDFIKSVF